MTLVEDWDEMTVEEPRRVVGTVFAEIHTRDGGIVRMLPRDDWKPYMQARASGTSAAKTVGY